jgi:flagellar hook-basal body complex protein FliE
MSIGIEPVAASASAMTSALTGLSNSNASLTNNTAAESVPQPFGDLMTDAVNQVNDLQIQAHTAVAGLMTGTGVDVHEAMIAAQKADMAFELALSVRNKAVQAYQSVIGMQF